MKNKMVLPGGGAFRGPDLLPWHEHHSLRPELRACGGNPARRGARHPEALHTGRTGTVVDNATDEDGKEFFTITTPSENVFYLVIDRQRTRQQRVFPKRRDGG